MSLPEYITINGTRYASANFSDAARAQLQNVQAVDAELARLNQQAAIMQTARNAYVNALLENIRASNAEAPAKAKTSAKAPAKAASTAKPAAPKAATAKAAASAAKPARAPRKKAEG